MWFGVWWSVIKAFWMLNNGMRCICWISKVIFIYFVFFCPDLLTDMSLLRSSTRAWEVPSCPRSHFHSICRKVWRPRGGFVPKSRSQSQDGDESMGSGLQRLQTDWHDSDQSTAVLLPQGMGGSQTEYHWRSRLHQLSNFTFTLLACIHGDVD